MQPAFDTHTLTYVLSYLCCANPLHKKSPSGQQKTPILIGGRGQPSCLSWYHHHSFLAEPQPVHPHCAGKNRRTVTGAYRRSATHVVPATLHRLAQGCHQTGPPATLPACASLSAQQRFRSICPFH